MITVSSGAAAKPDLGSSGRVASIPAPSVVHPSTATSVEENRVCTIVFADVVGFTALSERFAPEEIKEIVDGCFETMTEVIEKHGGVVDKYIGDCVMAVFGVPRSTDNDAERAVQAALRLQQAVTKYGLRRRGRIKLTLRVGINTGRVFAGRVGGGARRDFTVMGDAVNVASRLQGHAPESSIVIGRDTFRHVTGVFQVEELAPVVAKGKSEPLACYRVIGPEKRLVEEPQDEFYGAPTRFVGRRAEADRLADLFDQVSADRRAHLALVHGPPGAGKSRVREEFQRDLSARGVKAAVFVGRGSHLSRDATFDLAATLLRGYFHVHVDDPREVVAQKIRNGVRAFGRRPPSEDTGQFLSPVSSASTHATPPSLTPVSAERAGLDPAELGDTIDALAMMLGADARGALTAAGESVDDLRARMCAAVARLFGLFAQHAPVLVLCDGLEAADDASLDLLEYLVLRLADVPILLVGFGRPALFERRPAFAEGRESASRIALGPLSRRATEELARDLLRRAPRVTADFVRQLVDRADGNPFVLKETLRVLVEAGAVERSVDDVWRIDEARLEQLQLPSTIYGIVQARLDRLSPEHRAALQRAAVVGRVFWEGAIEAMRTPGSGAQGGVRDQLERLRANDLVRARESSTFPSDREYAFADNVTREVAYESLSLRLREQHHRALASWLAGRGTVVVDGNPALLAFHYDRGNVPREATRHYVRAGDRGAALGLNADAIRSYERACDIADSTRGLGAEPASEGFDENRICEWKDRVRLRLALGDTLRRVGRLDESQTAYEEAWADILRKERRRAQHLDEDAVRTLDAAVQLRLGLVEKVRGAFPAALARYDEALRLLGPAGDPRLLAPLLAAIGFARYRLGDYSEAIASLKRGLRACVRIPRREPDFTDAASHLLFTLSIVFYQQNRLVQAERLGRQAARVVDERRFPQLAAIAHNNLGAVLFQRGEIARARDRFLESLELKEKIGDLYDLAVAHNNVAEVELLLGDARGALAHARCAVQFAEGLAAADALPDAVRNYAAALHANGDVVGALTQAERAFQLCCEPAGRAYLAPAAATLAQIAGAARTAELAPAGRSEVDAAITRVREKAPHRARVGRARVRGRGAAREAPFGVGLCPATGSARRVLQPGSHDARARRQSLPLARSARGQAPRRPDLARRGPGSGGGRLRRGGRRRDHGRGPRGRRLRARARRHRGDGRGAPPRRAGV
ncbi:MAG: tetratricopeptide repeat protein [Myxococcales bacterium]|nr:tetratricopeptide repeat protein [Myxococcales bacterium]